MVVAPKEAHHYIRMFILYQESITLNLPSCLDLFRASVSTCAHAADDSVRRSFADARASPGLTAFGGFMRLLPGGEGARRADEGHACTVNCRRLGPSPVGFAATLSPRERVAKYANTAALSKIRHALLTILPHCQIGGTPLRHGASRRRQGDGRRVSVAARTHLHPRFHAGGQQGVDRRLRASLDFVSGARSDTRSCGSPAGGPVDKSL